jgi:signal transduction histidine kinase/ligand-binding sensor domain-containing protein
MRAALLLIVGLLVTPANAATADDLLTGYSLTSWHDDAGRTLGSVDAIVQDRDGYLWVASESGLLRFDGSRFTRWSRLSEFNVPAAPARSLHLARDGSLWVGFSQKAGVGRIRGGRLTPIAKGLEAIGVVTDLVEDLDGVMWAVGDRMLFRLDGGQWRRVPLPWRDREGQVFHIYVSRRGELWVGTRWGVFRSDRTTGDFRLVDEELVWGVGEDPAGRMWVTDIAAGFRQVGEPAPRTLEGGGHRFIHDRQGTMWLATFGAGLWRVTHDTRGYVVKRAVVRSGLSSDSVLSILEDRDANLWVGTPAGLHRLTRRRLASIDDSGPVLVTEPDAGGGLWVGTAGGLLHRNLATENGDVVRIGAGARDIRTFYTDRRGVLWMGTGGGLWQYDGRRLAKASIPERPDMFVRWLAPRPRGGLWLSDTDWLYLWQGGRLRALEVPAGGAARRIRFARADRSGRVWVGFSDGGLGYLDAMDALHAVGSQHGLPEGVHQTIDAVFEDRDGVVWIGGSGGLSRYANGRVVTLGPANGLPAGRVAAIIDDLAGSLWVTMERGLIRLRRADLDRAVADSAYRVRYEAYDALDGLAGAAVGMINATRTADGALWFAQGGGLTHATPRELQAEPDRTPAPAQIAAVVTSDNRMTGGRPSFPPGTRRLEIQYTAATLTDAKQVRFRYRLDGVDPAWVDAGTERTAVYTNLAPGAYVFQVASTVEGGASSAPAAEWRFSIEPLFWETRWFYGLAAAAVALAAWAAWRARMRLAERQFALALAERARLSRELHDTLLQSLVGVALQVDAVSGAREALPSWARQRLVRIREQVEEYIRDARQSIHDLRSPQLEEHGLVGALRQFGRKAVASTPTRFAMTTSGSSADCPSQIENELLRIGQEAITNAVRHGGAARVQVDLAYTADAISLRVADDGRGFDDQAWHGATDGHFGLRTMSERATELGAAMSVTSTIGRGTVVTVAAPRHPDRSGTRRRAVPPRMRVGPLFD